MNLQDWEHNYDDVNIATLSEEVEELCQKRHAKVKKMVAVDQFMMLLLEDGRIYCRGNNNGGVFGARQNPLVMSDVTLSRFAKVHDEHYKGEKIVDFEVASNALIFKTESNRVFYNGMVYAWNPRPFPIDVTPKKLFASANCVGVVADDGKMWYLNEKIINDSELVNQNERLYLCEDPHFDTEVLHIGGKYHLRYALLK